MKRIARFAILVLALGTALGQTKAAKTDAAKTDAEIKQDIIKDSIASYNGSCPCPYNKDRAGKSLRSKECVQQARWACPLCYDKDVTQKMVDEYRKRTAKHSKVL
jgi:hypothetical protein